MALARNRRSERAIDYWPGFVDALSTLLLAFMFLLTVFVLAQALLSREISGKDEALNRLNTQINELTQLLALERTGKQDAEDQLLNLQASLNAAETEKSRLQLLLEQGAGTGAAAERQLGEVSGQLDAEKAISERALAQARPETLPDPVRGLSHPLDPLTREILAVLAEAASILPAARSAFSVRHG